MERDLYYMKGAWAEKIVRKMQFIWSKDHTAVHLKFFVTLVQYGESNL